MSVTKKSFGTVNGKEVSLFTIKNSKGMEAVVTDFGAILVALNVPDAKGEVKDVVLGYDKVEDYMENGSFFGATVGRNANRIADAKFTIDGTEYKLKVNDNANNLHSDADLGFHKRIWEAQPEENAVVFFLESEDMDMGFPGNLKISVTYKLTEENAVEIIYDGVSDKKTTINLTNHSYFNLAGHDAGSESVYRTKLQLNASCYTPVVAGAIPTGEIAKVAGTVMDFTSPKEIGKEIDADEEQLKLVQGYDHNFVIDDYDGKLKLVATATEAGLTMDVYSDLPGIQFYAGNCISPTTGKNGTEYGKRAAFCLETQYFPNSINQEGFVKPVFDAGERYFTKTVYQFK